MKHFEIQLSCNIHVYYTIIALRWGQSLDISASLNIAYIDRAHKVWGRCVIFTRLIISMDCTNFKEYICYISLKLTKCQINLWLLLYFTYKFLQHFHYNLTNKIIRVRSIRVFSFVIRNTQSIFNCLYTLTLDLHQTW